MEENYKPSTESKRILNPIIPMLQKLVGAEVLKLLEANGIAQTSFSKIQIAYTMKKSSHKYMNL